MMTIKRLLLVMIVLPAAVALAQDATETAPPRPCSEPEARQFDFWVGQWEVHAKGKVVGHNRISRIHGGCTLLEEYDTLPGPYEGKSFNYYDAGAGRWHQVWVDNGGTRLHLEGGYADHQMVMSGERAGGTGTDRITWTDNQDGTVRQVWDVSQDGGATWKTIFDGLYKPVSEAPAQER
jgi:hypothetical protein